MTGLLDLAGSPHGGGHMLLPEWDSQPLITARTIIDHSQVGSTDGTFLLFRDRSNLESHFSVRGRRSGARDGRIEQFCSIDREADANLDANRYAVSIETEDDGDPDNQPWTTAQLESLAWLHERLIQLRPTIPRRESRSCADPAGLGCHTLHGAPSCWTPVAKTCPGRPVRFRQWEDVLLPAFLEGTMPIPDTDLDRIEARVRSAVDNRLSAPGTAARIGVLELVQRAVAPLLDDEAKIIAAGEAALQETIAGLANLARLIQAVDAGMDPDEARAAAAQMAEELKAVLPAAFLAALKETL